MNKNNIILVTVLAALVVVMIAVSAFFVPKIISDFMGDEQGAESESPELQEGESLGTLGKYQIHDKLNRNSIAKIHIHNSVDDYSFVRDKSGDFVIEGLEDLPYNEKYFSALVSIVGNPLALVKVDSDDSGYEEYGIKDSDVYWEVTSTTGEVYRMTVGHMIHTGGGYYVAYEGRKAVYVLGGDISEALGIEEKGTTLDLTVLKPIEFYVTPVLIAGIDTNDFYTMDNFTVFHGEDIFFSAKIVDKEDQVNPDALVENILTYPAPYQTNDNIYYQVLQTVAALGGTSVAKAGATEEDYKTYGLDEPGYMIAFYYKDVLYTIVISEKNEDGTYYVTSSFNPTIVAVVDGETLSFLEEELLYWISPNPFSYNITGIDKISVSGKDAAYDFYLRHGVDEDNKATLVVDAQNLLTGENKTIATEDKVWDFRSSYRTVLYTQIEDEVPLTEAQIDELTADESKLVLTYEYTLSSGTKRTLKFWQYSTRRTLLTIDGEGQYYVYLDRANKILSDFTKVWMGETVDSHAKD